MAGKQIAYLDLSQRTVYRACNPPATGALTITEDDMRAELIELTNVNTPGAGYDANFPFLDTHDKGYKVWIKNASGRDAQIQAATNAAGTAWTTGQAVANGFQALLYWTGTDFDILTDVSEMPA